MLTFRGQRRVRRNRAAFERATTWGVIQTPLQPNVRGLNVTLPLSMSCVTEAQRSVDRSRSRRFELSPSGNSCSGPARNTNSPSRVKGAFDCPD
jgi:hypothetical protein